MSPSPDGYLMRKQNQGPESDRGAPTAKSTETKHFNSWEKKEKKAHKDKWQWIKRKHRWMNSNQCILVWASDIVWKKEEKKSRYCKHHNGICQCYSMNYLFQKIWGNLKKKRARTQANYDEAILIVYFLLFISPF